MPSVASPSDDAGEKRLGNQNHRQRYSLDDEPEGQRRVPRRLPLLVRGIQHATRLFERMAVDRTVSFDTRTTIG